MKTLIIFFAIIGLALNVAIAENVKPVTKANVTIEHNSYSLVKVAFNEPKAAVTVKIYDNDFSLLHTERIRDEKVQYFDISKLASGHYFLKVLEGGKIVYTEVIQKVK